MEGIPYKICIFGDGGVGKTTLVTQYLTGVFNVASEMTIGVEFRLKKLEIEGKKVSLQIWDLAGEKQFRFILPSYIDGSSGGIFMYDITRYVSFDHFNYWLEIFNEGLKSEKEKVPLMIVGGKLDLENIRAVSKNAGLELAEKNNRFRFFECSGKTGENVEQIFIELTREMMKMKNLI